MTDGIWIAAIGVVGVVIGGVISEARHWRKDRADHRLEDRQKELLRTLLADQDHDFRKLKTLMDTIGADEVTTKRLLIEVGARGSTKGKDLWTTKKLDS